MTEVGHRHDCVVPHLKNPEVADCTCGAYALAWKAEAEFYKRENARLYVDIELRNVDNARLRAELDEMKKES